MIEKWDAENKADEPSLETAVQAQPPDNNTAPILVATVIRFAGVDDEGRPIGHDGNVLGPRDPPPWLHLYNGEHPWEPGDDSTAASQPNQ